MYVGTMDPTAGADLPGELWDEAFDDACSLCYRDGADETGLCQYCRERVPNIGGCGEGLALVAALAGDGADSAALAHLTGCPDCRAFFARLASVERVAAIEADMDMETPHAAGLAIAAA